MCGILGLVAHGDKSLDLRDSEIIRMRNTMSRRGPDGEGFYREGSVAFGHCRLAIRDRQGGHQPWFSDDRQTVLVYNGELYNDQSLREQLAGEGWRFRTRCDTEVVLAAYRHWGESCVNHLHGMFAFLVHDFHQRRTFLARDRFGIKPLFYSRIGGGLQAASSIACLLQHPRFSKRPNLKVLSHYLSTLRLTLERDTVYQGIQQLLPGERASFRDNQLVIERYWEYPRGEQERIAFDDAVTMFREQLADAVSSRLVSDVPVGLFLSGGVDSSLIAALVPARSGSAMVGQCGGGSGGDQADFEQAAHCARLCGFDYGEVRVSPEQYQQDWQDLVRSFRVPLATPSDVIIFNLARRMKKLVGVVLGGEGADEALCGYSIAHWSGNDFAQQRVLAAGNWPYGDDAAAAFVASLRGQYRRDSFRSLTDHYFALNSLIPTSVKASLFRQQAWAEADRDEGMWEFYAAHLDSRHDERSAIERTMHLLHRVNLESLLARLDAATMEASLEARVPFTDHTLVEQLFRLPLEYKIDIDPREPAPYLASGELESRGAIRAKRVLRVAASQLLPPGLALRKKASFPTPVAAWLAGPWSEWAARRLERSEFAGSMFETRAVKEIAADPAAAGMWMWPLLNLCLWGDLEFGGGTPVVEVGLPASSFDSALR